jgi:transposase-like protein
MKNKIDGNDKYTPQEITALVKDCRASDLSVVDFARQHGIPSGRLHYWIYQKYRQGSPTTSRPSASMPRFHEVKVSTLLPGAEAWAAEVSLACGLRVRFSTVASPDWMVAVIQALQRPC